MANEADVTVRVKTIDQGSAGMQQYAKSLGGVKVSALAFAGAVGAAAVAGKKLYDTLRAGAVLETTEKRFDKLAESIGTTADTMLGKLRTATQGMISDMDLMAASSQIISLKLADNSDQVVRLATVAGTLNWDMQQVILTFANMSTMRLDALGLSVEEVKNKAKELEAQGMSAQAAFKEAVILAGEARLDVGGVGESEKAFKQLETAIANTRNELSGLSLDLANATGFTGWLSNIAKNIELNRQLEASYQAGKISAEQYATALVKAAEAPGQAAEALEWINGQLEDNNIVLLSNQNAWSAWANGVAIQAAEAETQATAAMTAIFRGIVATNTALTDWTKGAGAGMSNPGLMTQYAGDQAARRAANNLAFVRHDPEFLQSGRIVRATQDYDNLTAAVGGYTAAISEADLAQQRFMSAFDAELMAKVEDGLINEQGLVNTEAMNAALYEQAKAAGASAVTLAMLGAATGQFTEEQAEAALKAAVLQERIVQLAKGIASGQVSFGDALSGLATFKQNLDQTGQGSLPETIAQMVAGIPADDRTIAYLSDTSVVDDDVRRLRGTVVEIPVKYVPINAPPTTAGAAPAPTGTPTGTGRGRTNVTADVNLNFHGPANADDVKRGVSEGMKSFFEGLRIEGVPV